MGDQLDILQEMGAIKANRTLGGGAAPFLLGRGKLLLEELNEVFDALDSEPKESEPTAHDETQSWDVFIAHASEDKEKFVRPLAEELSNHIRVWYDEFTLTVGDSL